MNKQPTAIAIAVVQRGEEFLIGQRPADVPLAGYWEFPGGKIETNESPEEAAVRECLEETGIAARILFAYPQHVQQYDYDRLQLSFFACEPVDAAQDPCTPYKWVHRSKLANYQFPAGNQGLLKMLLGFPPPPGLSHKDKN